MNEPAEFEAWLYSRELSPRTVKEYLYYLDKFGNVQNLNQKFIDIFLQSFRHNIARAFIVNFKEFVLERRDLFPEVNFNEINEIRLPKRKGRKKRKLPPVLSERTARILESGMTDERNKLMLLLSFYCGLRIGGLTEIRPFDFNWDKWDNSGRNQGELKVTEKGNKERIVIVPQEVMLRLEDWIANYQSLKVRDSSKRLFTIGIRRWHDILRKESEKTLGYPVNPHLLRHSCGTWLKENGWDLQEIAEFLGHEDSRTTEIYAHISKTQMANKYKALFSQPQPNKVAQVVKEVQTQSNEIETENESDEIEPPSSPDDVPIADINEQEDRPDKTPYQEIQEEIE